MMQETRNIVILGASYAGLNTAHYLLKHVYPTLPKDPNITYKITLIDPSSKFYLRHAAPRAAADPGLVPLEKALLDIEPGFKQYGDEFTFVQARAISWDDEKRAVTIRHVDGAEENLTYHALVLATGSKHSSPLFSLQGTGSGETEEALQNVHAQLKTAKRIVVVGGGPTGVETAAEIAEALNGSPGCTGAGQRKADVLLLTSASKLLPALKEPTAKHAETYLRRLGVDVRYRATSSSVSPTDHGTTLIKLQDGEELEADLYISATGVQPLSDYVPAHLKDAKGYVKQNSETLRVDTAGLRVYAIGDVGSYSRNSIVDILFAVPTLATNIKRDLLAAHKDVDARPTGKDRLFKAITTEMQLVPVGRNKGVGALFGWSVPSLVVWLFKGRDYMVPQAPQTVNGEKMAKESVWKG